MSNSIFVISFTAMNSPGKEIFVDVSEQEAMDRIYKRFPTGIIHTITEYKSSSVKTIKEKFEVIPQIAPQYLKHK